jgi:REP element-mobilizing transposase RayT
LCADLTTANLHGVSRHRGEEPGAIHHVVPQGNGRRRIVEDDRDRNSYTHRFERVARELSWTIYASCLMDTHHHAVVVTDLPNLGVGLKRLQGGHARWFNERHGREGSVSRQHAWSRRISDDAHLFRACLYVVLNPVAAGLCRHPREWPWCSYRRIAGGDPEAYVGGEEGLLGMFGDSPAEARERYARLVGEMAEQVRAVRVASGAGLWRVIADAAAVEAPLRQRPVSD